MNDFDRVPKPEPSVPYKHFVPLPKKRHERKRLPALPCRECESYYASFPDSEKRAHLSCRHRGNPKPPTPPHYWDLDFPDYHIPIQKYTFKPDWQNKYRNALNIDSNTHRGLVIRLIPYFDRETCESLIFKLQKEISYLSADLCRVTLKDGTVRKVPRKVAVYGDENVTYVFSGTTYATQQWTETTLFLKNVAFELTGESYNLVVVNFYKNGKSYMGSHKDDEPDLDSKSSIVSFSFGAERLFVFKRPHYPNFELKLANGSVLVMKPPTNEYWFHELPPDSNVKDFRINLTFRKIKNE